MSQAPFGDNAATKMVKELLQKIHDQSVQQSSVYEHAAWFFAGHLQREIAQLQQQQADYQRKIDDASIGARQKLEQKLKETKALLKLKLQDKESQRLDRLRHLNHCIDQVFSLIQGDNLLETQQLSARALGSIALISPCRGKHIATINQRHKHLYKAILALRLLDQLLADRQIKNRYVLAKVADASSDTKEKQNNFIETVQRPLVMACLLQDIGLQHPDAQLILKGATGDLDPLRVLDAEQRQQLLALSFEQSQRYLQEGLGLDQYIGNSKAEREIFLYVEEEKHNFTLHLLKSAIQPEDGIGNLLKIPQVYTSVVLPVKQQFNYEHFPKVSALLKAGVAKGWYPAAVVDALLKITGFFPQGYGITYIPKDADRKDLDRYEYGIVNSLYPPEPEQPICRQVTRNLTYNHFGINLVISSDNNLYFPMAQRKLEKISEARLAEILSKLVSNFEERSSMDLIPKYWLPDEFFTYTKNQNLWNKVDTIRN